MFVTIFVACSGGADATSGSTGPGGSRGGPSGSDGSTGTADGGGDAAEEQGDGCYPGCLAKIFARCSPSFSGCRLSSKTDPQVSFDAAVCYDNGYKSVSHTDYTTATSTSVVTMNGKRCYATHATGVGLPMTIVYSDADGHEIATVDESKAGILTIQCNSKTYTADLNSAACKKDPVTSGCTEDASCNL